MKRISLHPYGYGKCLAHWIFCISFGLLCLLPANQGRTATPSSYRLAHPLTWMHGLPVGEMPGWSSDFWIQLEMGQANTWNTPFDFRNVNTGQIYHYAADFEQSTAVFEMGGAITSYLSFAVEIPYASRAGGFLDRMIDNFHIVVGSMRFERPNYDFDQSNLDIRTDDISSLDQPSANGVGNIKYKLKLWWLKWMGKQQGSCDCGFSTSLQIKVPATDPGLGLTSGQMDYSFMGHLGIPFGKMSALWITSGVTYLSDNPHLKDWPTNTWQQMTEVSMDFAVDKKWGVLFQARMESPFLNKEQVSFEYTTTTRKAQILERVASGWNSLVHWRGSESIGFRYRPNAVSQYNFLMIEDFAIGKFDEIDDELYITNAPDVAFAVQAIWGF